MSRWKLIIIGVLVGLLLLHVYGGHTSNSSSNYPVAPSVPVPAPGPPLTSAPVRISVVPRAPTTTLAPPAPVSKLASQAADVGGLVVSPVRDLVPVYRSPGGLPFSALPLLSYGGPTWLPVLASSSGWYEVGLDGPPNGLVGWVPVSSVHAAVSSWSVRVNVSARTLAVYRSGSLVGTWPVAVGSPATPTPTGTSFLAGDILPAGVDAGLGPAIRPLGLHSTDPVVDREFPGGLVAIHGWLGENTDPAVFGQAISHGCIRAPATAMAVIAQIPTGSPVVIS